MNLQECRYRSDFASFLRSSEQALNAVPLQDIANAAVERFFIDPARWADKMAKGKAFIDRCRRGDPVSPKDRSQAIEALREMLTFVHA